MRVIDNVNGRTPAIGIDATGKLKVRASVAGAGSTIPGTCYRMLFDESGWTASTLTLTTVVSRFYIGIAEQTITSGTATYPGSGKSTELYEFVIGGPTIIQSTNLTTPGTTGQGILFTTGAPVAASATYAGKAQEFAVYRRGWDTTANAFSTGCQLSTALTYLGSISTQTNYCYLVGIPINVNT